MQLGLKNKGIFCSRWLRARVGGKRKNIEIPSSWGGVAAFQFLLWNFTASVCDRESQTWHRWREISYRLIEMQRKACRMINIPLMQRFLTEIIHGGEDFLQFWRKIQRSPLLPLPHCIWECAVGSNELTPSDTTILRSVINKIRCTFTNIYIKTI